MPELTAKRREKKFAVNLYGLRRLHFLFKLVNVASHLVKVLFVNVGPTKLLLLENLLPNSQVK